MYFIPPSNTVLYTSAAPNQLSLSIPATIGRGDAFTQALLQPLARGAVSDDISARNPKFSNDGTALSFHFAGRTESTATRAADADVADW